MENFLLESKALVQVELLNHGLRTTLISSNIKTKETKEEKKMTNFVILIMALSSCKLVVSNSIAMEERGEGMRNKHLTIEGQYWDPFFFHDYDENGRAIDGTYRGILYDLLLFMQKARNFTFTIVSKADYVWGECYGINNCSGMIGVVNRKEVDLAIGNIFNAWEKGVYKFIQYFRTISFN